MRYVKLNVEPCVRDSLWEIAKTIGLPMTEILKLLTIELKDVVIRMLVEYVKYKRLGIPTIVEVSVRPREDILRLLGMLKGEECVEVRDLTSIGKSTLPKCVVVNGKKVRVFQGLLLEYPPNVELCMIDVDVVPPTEHERQLRRLSLCRCIGVIPWWRHRAIGEVIPPEEIRILDELWSTALDEKICRELEDPDKWFKSEFRKKMLGERISLPRYDWLDIVAEILEKVRENIRRVLGVELLDRKAVLAVSLMLGL